MTFSRQSAYNATDQYRKSPTSRAQIMRVAAPLFVIAWCLVAAACAAPPGAGLEDLGEQLLGDDLLRQIGPPPAARDEQLPDVDELRRMLQKPSGDQDESTAADSPLAAAQHKMQQAKALIETADLSGKTRQVQGEVVDQLDKLIAKLEQQCQNCQPGSGGKPNNAPQQTARSTPQPSASPSDESRPGSADKPADQPGQPQASQSASQQSTANPAGGAAASNSNKVDPQSMLKGVWGQLPERMRQQMLQSSSGEFLPKYRSDIEAYYKRLAAPEE
jgi:hypothetical protein